MTSRVVLDASAALHLVMDGKSSDAIAECLDEAQLVAAPDLFAGEVANGLWRYVEHGEIPKGARLADWRKKVKGCSKAED